MRANKWPPDFHRGGRLFEMAPGGSIVKWSDSDKTYKACISLGFTCQTAYQLQRLGLRRYAGPLDWFVSASVSGLVRLINNRFHGFMELNELEFIDISQDCYVARDNVYNVVSFHDFPLSLPPGRWQEAYPPFKEKLIRRISRFLTNVSDGPILFVRTGTTKKEAKKLQAALNALTGGRHRLLIINYHSDNRKDIAFEDWGLPGVFTVRMHAGEDWRGSDQAWDTCMQGFTIQRSPSSHPE
jgi:hypothetical protein